MKRGTAAKVILGKDTLMDVPAGIVHGTDVILGGKAGLLNDFGGLVLSNNLMIGKKVSRGTITTVTVRGQSPLVLPDAIAGSLQAVKAFGGTEQNGTPTPDAPVDIVSNNGALKVRHQSGLPFGYTLLDFVTNASGTRINTGIYDDIDDFSIEIRVEPSGGSWYICQSRANSNAQIYGLSGGSSGARITMGAGLSDAVATSGISRNPSHIYTIIGSHKNGVTTLYVKDETTGDEDTQTTTYDTNDFTAAPTTIGVWGQASNTVNANNDIYYLKIRKGGVLVADYVPCQYNGENGFYDFVSQSFFGAFVGTINAGNPVSDPVVVYADGTVETIEDTIGNTATTETLLKVGGYQDEQEMLSGAVTRNVGIRVLDGTEDSWSKGNNSFVNTALFADKKREKSKVFCSHFQYDTGSTSSILDGCVGCASTSVNTYFRNDALSTVEDWTQWLADQYAAGTPVIVIYPLRTPTTESVTGQTLQVTSGDNVLEITQASLDNLELEATYKSLVQLTIQEVEDANLNNNVEVTIS